VGYAKIVAFFVSADVPWPSALRQAFVYLSVLNFNIIELLGMECTVKISYEQKFFMYQIAPAGLAMFCAELFLLLRLLALCTGKGKDGTKLTANLSNNVLGMYLIGFNLMYLILWIAKLHT
jgi:hypothetical protein